MAGEIQLTTLLEQMKPILNEGQYVFCSFNDLDPLYLKKAIGMFREKEGVTLIMERGIADEFKLSYQLICSWITLTIHSSLEAVGLTAAFSGALSNAGISCNVVAAFYHDHIFVPREDTGRALEILAGLGKEAKDV